MFRQKTLSKKGRCALFYGLLNGPLACLLFFPDVVYSEWLGGIEVGYQYDDNINRAEIRRDIREDSFVNVFVDGGRSFFFGDSNIVLVKAQAEYQEFDKFDGLNNLALGLRSFYIKKIGLGAFAPRLKLTVGAEHLDFKEDLRDSWKYRVQTSFSQRIDERWRVAAEISYQIRRQDDVSGNPNFDTDVFDQKNFRAGFNIDFAISEPVLIDFNYGFLKGDFNSTAIAPNARFVGASDARTSDPVFGANTVAYRIDAELHIIELGLSWGFHENVSLNLGCKRLFANADKGIQYDADRYLVNLLISY